MPQAIVLNNRRVAGSYYRLSLNFKSGKIKPGQFVMLRVSDSFEPLLRRPFSVAAFKRGRIEILYKVVGKGTELMSNLKKGGKLDVLGPLGGGIFPKVKDAKNLVMVAGGIGIAPFHMVVASIGKAASDRKNVRLFYGARTKNDALLCGEIQKAGVTVTVATEDGSVGVKGLVTDIVKREINSDTIIYACGPTGMLKAVAGLAREKSSLAYVSLERGMACGIGVCLGCAVAVNNSCEGHARYKMVCSSGPVFKSDEIDWARI